MNRYPGGTPHENGGHKTSTATEVDDDEDDESLSRDDDPRRPLSPPRQRQQEDTPNRGVRQSPQRGVTKPPPRQQQQQQEEEEEDTDETEEQQHDRIIARILAERWAAMANGVDDDENDSLDSAPRDPLERLNQMEEEDEKRKSIEKIRLEPPRKGGTLSGVPTNDSDKKRTKSTDDELVVENDEKELVRRIVELRIAAIEAGELNDDNSITSEPPQDPLVRIMNMNAEDTLIAAVSLKQYGAQPEVSDEDDDDALVRNRDIFDLNNMILNNNLEDLEKKAIFLAQSVKNKLDQVDTPPYTTSGKNTPNNNSSSDITGIGYLALAKDAVNRSMETAKVDVDDDNERRVRRNDLLHEATILSPKSRKMYIQQFPTNTKTPPSIRISAIASERGWDEKVGNESPVSPRKKHHLSSHVEVPVSDWWGVVSDIAAVGAGSDTWESDSQSNLSYGSTDSAVTGSDTDENLQRLPNGGGAIDWEGINAAIQRQHEMSAILPPIGEGRLESTLDEKRRKKRELEALKISISTSAAQRDMDAWRLSLTKSGL